MSGRSMWAVIAGALVVIIASTLLDVVMRMAGVFPPLGEPITHGGAALATAYRAIIAIAGGWLAARLAPENALGHAIMLGFVGAVAGLIGVFAWRPELGPRWYPIAIFLLALPECWIGGRMYEGRKKS